MPLFLRTIRKNRWYNDKGLPWLPEGSIQADPLADLNTKDNKLSVWHIEDDKHNLEQVVTAVAANRDSVSNLDYALFDQGLLSKINIKIEETKGNTKDKRANIWHRDLDELSASKLVNLAKIIMGNAEKKRYSEKQVLHLIKQAVESGNIDLTKLKEKIQIRISSLLR